MAFGLRPVPVIVNLAPTGAMVGETLRKGDAAAQTGAASERKSSTAAQTARRPWVAILMVHHVYPGGVRCILVTDLLIAYPSGIPITTRRIPKTTYDHTGATVFVCT